MNMHEQTIMICFIPVHLSCDMRFNLWPTDTNMFGDFTCDIVIPPCLRNVVFCFGTNFAVCYCCVRNIRIELKRFAL